MNSRHRAREVALQILYRYDVASHADGIPIPQGAELATDLAKHFDHFQVPESLREFAAELVAGTLTHLATLDPVLEKHASNWKVSRMSFIDRMLLRMATFELQKMPDTPPSVVLDEAIELSKQFGAAESPAFVNGVLDAISDAVSGAIAKTTRKD